MHSVEYAGKVRIKKIITVAPGVKTGINIKYDNPKVGADRIVNAVAGYQIYGVPLVCRFALLQHFAL